MALSRFNSMLSWNPLSKKFWQSDNWSGIVQTSPQITLESEKRALQNAVDDAIPDCIKDLVMMCFPEHPVFTPYGHCFEHATLTAHWQTERRSHTTCPFTTRPLHEGMLLKEREIGGLLQHFNVIKRERELLLNKIDQMSGATQAEVWQEFQKFKLLIELEKPILQEQIDRIIARDRINLRKERLQIDASSTAHLLSWHQKKMAVIVDTLPEIIQRPILATTGHEVFYDTQRRAYVIPRSIATVMHAAEKEYKSADDFLSEVKKNIHTEKKSFRPHLWCATRSAREKAFLDAEDIDQLDMRKII